MTAIQDRISQRRISYVVPQLLFEDLDAKSARNDQVGSRIKIVSQSEVSEGINQSKDIPKRLKLQIPLKQLRIHTEVDRSLESDRRSIAVIEKYTGISANFLLQSENLEKHKLIG